MRFANIARLYRVRLRARWRQEAFAVLGISIGVALLFVSQVATHSLSSAIARLNSGVVGKASLQLAARDPHGFPSRILREAREVTGVVRVAAVFEVNANAVGPRGNESIKLLGVDESLAALGGIAARVKLTPFAGIDAVLMPTSVADRVGVRSFGNEVTLQVAGRESRAPLYAELHEHQVGSLVDSPIIIAPLDYVQEVAGVGSRLTRVLVQAAPDRVSQVRLNLQRRFGRSVNVELADSEQQLFGVAADATNKSTDLFALMSALVGFLLAFNAVLFAVPQRRRLISGLRRDGYAPRDLFRILVLDALVLGMVACAVGLLVGDELSIHLFGSAPGYLASGFTVGTLHAVNVTSVVFALCGGMMASLIAVLAPVRCTLSGKASAMTQGVPGGVARAAHVRTLRAAGVLAGLAMTMLILLFDPQLATLGVLCLAGAMLLGIAWPLDRLPVALSAGGRLFGSVVAHVVSMQLRSGRSRSIAIAATGAVAVFGGVAIEGARHDLLAGLDDAARDTNAIADVWVSPAGASNLLMVEPFKPIDGTRLKHLPGIRAVEPYRGGLLDYGKRRVWVMAPSERVRPLIPPSQVIEGDRKLAEERLRAGGWAVVSLALAREHDLRIGRAFVLPAPRETRLRVAAISSNVGWAPGAVLMSATTYARAWNSEDLSAYDIFLRRGFSTAVARREIRATLGPKSGLSVQSAQRRAATQRALTRQGLAKLTLIATLILVAAILAMAGAIGAAIWQRRPQLAMLKLEGFTGGELWRITVLEGVLTVGVGCAFGGAFGLLGQQFLDRALEQVVNYPMSNSIALLPALVIVGGVVAAAAAALLVLGGLVVRVPASLALREPGQ